MHDSTYRRVVEPIKGEGESIYRNYWRNTAKERARSRYLDHLEAARAHDDPEHAVNQLFDRAIDFDAADANFSGALSFGEFARLVRSMDHERTGEPRSNELLRSWFNDLDVDGNGVVTKAEYFHYAIRESACGPDRGNGLRGTFARVDTAGTGKINRHDFRRACERMGFGEVATELYGMMPADQFGRIDYKELIRVIRRRYAKTPEAQPSPSLPRGHSPPHEQSFHQFAAAHARQKETTGDTRGGEVTSQLASMLDLRRSERQEQPSEHRRLSAASSDTHDGDDDDEEGVPSHVTSLRVELLELMQTSGTSTADIFRFIE